VPPPPPPPRHGGAPSPCCVTAPLPAARRRHLLSPPPPPPPASGGTSFTFHDMLRHIPHGGDAPLRGRGGRLRRAAWVASRGKKRRCRAARWKEVSRAVAGDAGDWGIGSPPLQRIWQCCRSAAGSGRRRRLRWSDRLDEGGLSKVEVAEIGRTQ
jgi:hypothetical protein